MTKLSPQAQAVRDAVLATYADNIPKDDDLWAIERASTVAALHAVADQVMPEQLPKFDFLCGYTLYRTTDTIRHQLHTIATELENAQ